jgi:hypothetical protein
MTHTLCFARRDRFWGTPLPVLLPVIDARSTVGCSNREKVYIPHYRVLPNLQCHNHDCQVCVASAASLRELDPKQQMD